MNYKKIYDAIIERAKSRFISKDIYTENHHIYPSCMGGSDEKWNRVDLTGKEHCLAHLLLVKIYFEEKSLVYAAFMMYNKFRKTDKKYNCRIYEMIRKEVAKVMSERVVTKETCEKISETKSGKKLSKETREKISKSLTGKMAGENHPMWGKHQSEEKSRKQSQTMRGRIFSENHKQKLRNPKSEEHRRNISISTKGRNKGIRHSEDQNQRQSERVMGEKNPMFGKHHTKESKQKSKETRKRNKENYEYK